VTSIDPGATLKVNWYDFGVGNPQPGFPNTERYDLTSHALVTGPLIAPSDERIIVTRIHNKPQLEYVLTGGNATFGVYITLVSSFATDSDAALVAAGQPSSSNDRGSPTAILDPTTGQWQFASGVNGVQNVAVDGTISTSDLLVTGVQQGATGAGGLSFGSAAELLSFTPVAQVKVPKIVAGGGSRGLFELQINGQVWAFARSSYQTLQVPFDIGTLVLEAGDTLSVIATNESESGNPADYFAFAYTGT
jgi:hypothetical protein